MSEAQRVSELRLVVTTDDREAAVAFYRDVLGLREIDTFRAEGGANTLLQAGRATVEITDQTYAAYIDEVEVGRRVAGHIRVAFAVDDSMARTADAVAAGADLIAEPTVTPWNSRNARLNGPAGLQLTLFTDL